MARTRTRAAGLAVGALLMTGALGACGSTVDTEDVTQQVDAAIAEAAGEEPETTDCPDDLEAEEGASTTCTVTVAGEDHDVDVEVTGVSDDSADFDISIPEELRSPAVPATTVAEQVSTQLAASVGEQPDDVTCAEDLPAEVDASITCLLTAGGDEFDTAVTVTAVEGEDVAFDIEVAQQPNP